ncbi:MAG: hypothetical protein Q9222_002773 [Ikaeria aurantiellina]
MTDLTGLLTSIPSDFNIKPHNPLAISFAPEACFTNIVAGLGDVAIGEFTRRMAVINYRTTRFPQPLIKIGSPDSVYVARNYVVWGLFLSAFYLYSHNAFHLMSFGLEWKGVEVGAIFIGSQRSAGTSDTAVKPAPGNADLKVDFAFFGGAQELGKSAVFMVMIASIMEAAPQAAGDAIHETVINILNDNPVAFIATPTRAARGSRGPFFTNLLLIDSLARSAEFFVASGSYRQMEMNISIDGVQVAQAAFVQRRNLALWNATVGEDEVSVQ